MATVASLIINSDAISLGVKLDAALRACFSGLLHSYPMDLSSIVSSRRVYVDAYSG